jgi:hypothetical protein
MNNDKESAFGLTLLLAAGYCYRLADRFGSIRARLTNPVTDKGSALRSGQSIHRDNAKGSEVVAETSR